MTSSKKKKGTVTKNPVDKVALFGTFREEETAEIMPKDIRRSARMHSVDDICYLENICSRAKQFFDSVVLSTAYKENAHISNMFRLAKHQLWMRIILRDLFATVTVVVANRGCVTKCIKIQTGESATKLNET